MSRSLGRYELVRPLARGGMAEVYLARRRAAGVEKLLVVKRIRSERAGDIRFRELFKREATLSMSLTHQNIVQTFDFGSVGEQFFLAMERVEGRDLGSSLDRAPVDDKLPPLIASFIAAECCQALGYAHSRRKDGAHLGVVHRDVTLRNVLVSWSGEVKLTDFGIATLAGDDTSKLVGTPAFMAPEQARGEAIDVRTDVYGVGMVLRELLTGERARPGEDRDALIAAARLGTLAPWTGDIDPALVAIVDRATSASPADRYTDAGEMHAELDTFIVAQRAAKRGESPARQLAAWLAKIWGDERDDTSEADIELSEGGAELMSFLDDGAAIGTGTERSLAATAADEPVIGVSSPVPPKANEPPSVIVEPQKALEPPAPIEVPPRRRLVPLLLAAAAAVVLSVIAFGRTSSTPTPSGSAVAIAPDAASTKIGPQVDAASVESVDATALDEPKDAVVVVKPPDRGSGVRPGSATPRAGSGSATARTGSGSAAVRVGSGSATVRAGSGSGSGSAVVLRKVHINATPWAFFSVDGGPRHQTPKMLELTPGPHQIHFENNVLKVERTITLVVPADRDMSHVEPLR